MITDQLVSSNDDMHRMTDNMLREAGHTVNDCGGKVTFAGPEPVRQTTVKTGPANAIILAANAVKLGDRRITFMDFPGNLPTAWTKTLSWPLITKLRRNLYEHFDSQSNMYTKWWADRMLLIESAKAAVGTHLESLKEFSPARVSSLSLGQMFEMVQYAKPGQ